MTGLERHAREIFRRVVADCDPAGAFDRRVSVEHGVWIVGDRRVEFGDVDDVRVIAIGKPAVPLLVACSRALDRADVVEDVRRGIAAVPPSGVDAVRAIAGSWIAVEAGGHPFPDEGSFRAGRAILELCSSPASSKTLVIALIGGGGSAMAEWPANDGAAVESFAELNRCLVQCELSIREINAVRKRVSAIKGGRIALAARPASILTLLVSDVTVGDVGSIASGPTVEDRTTRDDAIAAISKLERSGMLTDRARALVQTDLLVEPPNWTEVDRRRCNHVVLLDSTNVAASAERHSGAIAGVVRNLGVVDGPLDAVVHEHVDALAEVTAANPGVTCAVVSSGEATLDVRGVGTGGRNQHFALAALVDGRTSLGELADFAILSAGTDGVDGNSNAAGAVVVPGLLGMKTGHFDATIALRAFDSATFLARVGAQIVCGPTGTNVRDLRVCLGIRR